MTKKWHKYVLSSFMHVFVVGLEHIIFHIESLSIGCLFVLLYFTFSSTFIITFKRMSLQDAYVNIANMISSQGATNEMGNILITIVFCLQHILLSSLLLTNN